MTGGFVSKRRADEFDALLSTPASERDEAAAAPYADLLDVVGELRAVPPVEARPEFVSDLRARLVVAAARQPARVDDATAARLTPRQRRGARERRLATVLGGFAVVAASGSMAMASQAALPGDVLYPVKRAIENAQTNLQSDEAERAETLLAHAERRLHEVEELSARGDAEDADEIAATLQDFTEQANQATELSLEGYETTGDSAAVHRLRTFAGSTMTDLTALGDRIPTDARPALITAAQTVQQADNAAFNACPTCGDGGVTQLPEFAAQTVALPSTLLGLDTSADSVIAPAPEFLKKVERKAQDVDDTDPGGTTTDPGGTSTTPETDEQAPGEEIPEVELPEEKTPGPVKQIEEQIDDIVKPSKEHPPRTLEETTTDLVEGVVGLVGGLLTP